MPCGRFWEVGGGRRACAPFAPTPWVRHRSTLVTFEQTVQTQTWSGSALFVQMYIPVLKIFKVTQQTHNNQQTPNNRQAHNVWLTWISFHSMLFHGCGTMFFVPRYTHLAPMIWLALSCLIGFKALSTVFQSFWAELEWGVIMGMK